MPANQAQVSPRSRAERRRNWQAARNSRSAARETLALSARRRGGERQGRCCRRLVPPPSPGFSQLRREKPTSPIEGEVKGRRPAQLAMVKSEACTEAAVAP